MGCPALEEPMSTVEVNRPLVLGPELVKRLLGVADRWTKKKRER
jgi:hypothetical protein